MAIEFPCGSCGRLLRTPDDTAGQQAQCPHCGSLTTIPAASAAEPTVASVVGHPATANPFQAAATGDAFVRFGPGDLAARNRVAGPAMALIVLSAIGLLLQIASLPVNVMRANPMPLVMGFDLNEHRGTMTMSGVVSLVIGGVMLAGGIKMRNLESRGLALTAAILSCIPCLSPCCCISLPFGIWAIVTLNDPVVRTAFRS